MLACRSLLACSLEGAATGPIQTEQPAGASEDAGEGGSGPANAGPPPSDASAPGRLDAGPSQFDGALPNSDASTSADAAQLGRDGSTTVDAGPPSLCSAQGKYALRIDFDVRWDTTLYYGTYPVFAAGAGKFSLLAQLTLRSGTAGPEATVVPCGTNLPDFGGASEGYTNERYNSYVPSSSWNALSMPAWTLPWQGDCADRGCSLAVDRLVAVLGARLTGTDAAGNPTVASADHDGDGRRGITFLSRGPLEVNAANMPYQYITLGSTARARKLDLLLGITSTLKGSFQSCDLVSGEQLVGGTVEQHAWGCTGVLADDPAEIECDQATSEFLEQALPQWKVTASRFRAVRVPENSCNTVRTTLRD